MNIRYRLVELLMFYTWFFFANFVIALKLRFVWIWLILLGQKHVSAHPLFLAHFPDKVLATDPKHIHCNYQTSLTVWCASLLIFSGKECNRGTINVHKRMIWHPGRLSYGLRGFCSLQLWSGLVFQHLHK